MSGGATYVLGADIGGTNQTVALARSSGEVVSLRRRRLRPGGTAQDVLANVVTMAEETIGEFEQRIGEAPLPLIRFGVGFGGPVDYRRGTVITSHHVSGWDSFPLADALQARFGVPTVLDNDANAAALGETLFGAGTGAASVLYVNVGTGIGAGIVLNGAVLHGFQGMAGEIGHMTVRVGGLECACGKRGCLEAYASGRSLARRAQIAAADQPDAAAPLLRLAGGTVSALSGRHVLEAARIRDPLALRLVEETAGYLGLALGNAANLLDPERIILGGGVSTAGDLLFVPLRDAVARHTMPGMRTPPIVPAQLGYDAGVIGAVALAL
jgi:glucokinase